VSFKYAILKQAKTVRGPQVVCVKTFANATDALAEVTKLSGESADTFYVCEVVAKSARVVQLMSAGREKSQQETADANARSRDYDGVCGRCGLMDRGHNACRCD
jgi:hypothetical protein